MVRGLLEGQGALHDSLGGPLDGQRAVGSKKHLVPCSYLQVWKPDARDAPCLWGLARKGGLSAVDIEVRERGSVDVGKRSWPHLHFIFIFMLIPSHTLTFPTQQLAPVRKTFTVKGFCGGWISRGNKLSWVRGVGVGHRFGIP